MYINCSAQRRKEVKKINTINKILKKEDKKFFAEKLRQEALNKKAKEKISLASQAKDLGFSRQAFNKYLMGEYFPKESKSLNNIIKYYNKDISFFLPYLMETKEQKGDNNETTDLYNSKIGKAAVKAHKNLNKIFNNLVKNLTFIHVDESGYWFDFCLTNNNQIQHYVVRHNELD